jgi:ring-1,2-phenylacetyl-CoA epoxidase subunit PaaC
MEHAVTELWGYTGELFIPAPYEREAAAKAVCPDPGTLESRWLQKVNEIFAPALLQVPANVYMHKGGKEGNHTEYMGFVLAELQFMQRAYPGAEW